MLAFPIGNSRFKVLQQLRRTHPGQILVISYERQPKNPGEFSLNGCCQFIRADQENCCEVIIREIRCGLLRGLAAQAHVLILQAFIKNVSLGAVRYRHAFPGYFAEVFLPPSGDLDAECLFRALSQFAKEITEKTRTLMVNLNDSVLLVLAGSQTNWA